jgi:two-component system, NarL family, nitrate/nitrite response regulator NarL
VPTRPRVLLVEDHPGVVKALSRVLSPACDVVGVIGDGGEVADAAARLQPVVIVVDLNLPNVSGLDVCRQITQNDPRMKVIVITAMADDALRDEALAAGASGFFHKSAAAELIVAITRIWTEST